MQITAESWTHLEIVAGILIPITLFWLDTRRRVHQMHLENQEKAHQMHVENQTRFTAIETMIRPMWKWWNDRRDRS